MRYIGVDIPDDDFQWLDDLHWVEKTTVAALVRDAIKTYRESRTASITESTVAAIQSASEN